MLRLRAMGTVPRLLADDLETMAFVPRHPALMRRARQAIDCHLPAMGTRASTGKAKSHVFALAKSGRRRLRKELAGTDRAVLFHWRDLGAHANVAKHTWGPVLTKRMEAATRASVAIRALPGDPDSKARIVQTQMLPAAAYGSETTYVADSSLARLRGAVYSVVRSRCSLGGNEAQCFAETAIRGCELDPELIIAHRRLVALGRAWRGLGVPSSLAWRQPWPPIA